MTQKRSQFSYSSDGDLVSIHRLSAWGFGKGLQALDIIVFPRAVYYQRKVSLTLANFQGLCLRQDVCMLT